MINVPLEEFEAANKDEKNCWMLGKHSSHQPSSALLFAQLQKKRTVLSKVKNKWHFIKQEQMQFFLTGFLREFVFNLISVQSWCNSICLSHLLDLFFLISMVMLTLISDSCTLLPAYLTHLDRFGRWRVGGVCVSVWGVFCFLFFILQLQSIFFKSKYLQSLATCVRVTGSGWPETMKSRAACADEAGGVSGGGVDGVRCVEWMCELSGG